MQVIKISLYILAGLSLVLGLISGISLIASSGNLVANLLMPVQLLGGEAIFNLIAPMLTGFLKNLGIGMIIFSLIFSVLLYAIGRLLGQIASLEDRLNCLEKIVVK